jgi:succinyldiaminopimelate transaminase
MRVNPALDRVGAHPITAIQEQVRELRARGEEVLDFSLGDPIEPTWEQIPAAVAASVPAVSQYPTTRGLPELRRAISGYVRRRFDIEIDPDIQVIPTSGAKEAIFSSHLAFVDRERGDVVGYPDPGYPVYARGAALAGAEPRPVAAGGDFVVGAGQVAPEDWKRMAMLWICTPSNPSGAVTSLSQLDGLVSACRSHGVLLCSDECYVDLYEDDPPPSVLQSAGPGSEGVLSFLSLSKRSGMTGYRSGAIVGDPAAIERIFRLRTSTGTASPEFVQQGAITAWNDDEHVAARRRIFNEKRRVLRSGLSTGGIEAVASGAGLYLWVKVDDDLTAATDLAAEGVVVSPGRIFGERGVGFLRLALVPDVDTCRRAAEIMVRVLAQ